MKPTKDLDLAIARLRAAIGHLVNLGNYKYGGSIEGDLRVVLAYVDSVREDKGKS